ncbi:GntR family transcriptional regulator [Thalassococcus sp. CAU 1522]|uniref:GntR family transcriptional regulator n=1 Tax=Thalassococcus arenae TaxID=2851652 RepID=A0ABS6NC06_9RHOB|nr:GntR family transcriptional regulator [Thalassococcus arenae]MBV2361552.1 GntR family transcriptional regulator [Thalassococcus arenae]
MQKTAMPLVSKTTTDMVFDTLYEEIASLDLLPGTRISEAEVATRLGVSRQPVRDAFNRLGNLDLLLIRPQRATEVRGFSMPKIANARFIRLAVELEVVTRACSVWDTRRADTLEANIARQAEAIEAGQIDAFHAQDYEFHRLICALSGYPLAFETIEQCKRSIDRLCVLSLSKAYEASAVLEDHREIASALAGRSVDAARAVVTRHLSRLDETIREIHERHAEYFE